MSPSSENFWLSEKQRLACFHLECEQSGNVSVNHVNHSLWQGFVGVRRRQPVAEDGEQSLNTTPMHSSTPLAGAGSKDWSRRRRSSSSTPFAGAGSKDWRKNFASSPESDCSNNNNGDWGLGGDSGYGGLDSSRLIEC